MNFEELSTLWKNVGQESSDQMGIHQKLLKEVSMNKVRSQLSTWSSIFEIVFNIPFFLFFVDFLVDHLFIFKYAFPGFILVLLSLESIVYGVYKIYVYASINPSHSILNTQKSLERLLYLERLQINLLYILIPMLSLPFMVVFAKGLLDWDIYPLLGIWLIYYTLGSILIAVVIVFLLKRFPDKNLQDSLMFLKDLKDFEKQE